MLGLCDLMRMMPPVVQLTGVMYGTVLWVWGRSFFYFPEVEYYPLLGIDGGACAKCSCATAAPRAPPSN